MGSYWLSTWIYDQMPSTWENTMIDCTDNYLSSKHTRYVKDFECDTC